MAGIYVWGTGCGASELVEQGLKPEQIAAFVDNAPFGETFLGRPVLLPEKLPVENCDLVIVTSRQTEQIARQCEVLGIPRERMLFLKNSWEIEDRNQHCQIASDLLGDELLDKLLPRQQVIACPGQLRRSRLPDRWLAGDYVRLASLELLCRQAAQISGAAAELGVYKGMFARCINFLMPERKLYLFDSFSGFSPKDAPTAGLQEAHKQTTVEGVKAVLPFPDQAVICPGFFPDSAREVEEGFCLVSLDVDFFGSTLEGLRWFWPRIHGGGFLLLHDWGNPALPGIAQALDRYQQELGQPIPAVPIPDRNGTLVLCKVGKTR